MLRQKRPRPRQKLPRQFRQRPWRQPQLSTHLESVREVEGDVERRIVRVRKAEGGECVEAKPPEHAAKDHGVGDVCERRGVAIRRCRLGEGKRAACERSDRGAIRQ